MDGMSLYTLAGILLLIAIPIFILRTVLRIDHSVRQRDQILCELKALRDDIKTRSEPPRQTSHKTTRS